MGDEGRSAVTIDDVKRLLTTGDPQGALHASRSLLAAQPDHLEAIHLGGLALRALGRTEEAVASFAQALAIAPGAAVIHTCQGNALKALGRFDEAIAAHRRAVACSPGFAEAWSNLGGTLLEAGQPTAATQILTKATRLQPANADLRHNLGRVLVDAGDAAGAERELTRAIELDPTHTEARVTLGSVLRRLGRLDQAIEVLDEAIRLAPSGATAHWNRSLALLMRGNFTEGWAEYEWRRRMPDMRIDRIDAPAWDGSPLGGRTLLVHAEQGLGDTIQFTRFAPVVTRSRGPGSVVLRCPAKLRALLGGVVGEVHVVADDQPTPAFDVHAPLMSLPHLLGVGPDELATRTPYLRPDPDRSARWRSRIGSRSGVRVGVCWQGSPTYLADRERSLPLHQFLPLSQLPGVELISLQKGPGRAQLADFHGAIDDLGAGMDEGPDAFADTAAALEHLDLLVCSDTAIPHLAGALGKETWLLLAHVPDWRWMLHGDRCPWYPTMRLFRQTRPGDWEGVLGRVADALSQRMVGHGT